MADPGASETLRVQPPFVTHCGLSGGPQLEPEPSLASEAVVVGAEVSLVKIFGFEGDQGRGDPFPVDA